MDQKKNNLPIHPSLEYVGFINKSIDLEKFVKEITLGILVHFFQLQRLTASPIENAYFLVYLLFVMISGEYHPTLPKSNFGKLFKKNPEPQEVFQWIIDILTPYEKYIELRKNLLKQHEEFTWDKAVKNLKEILKSF